MYESLKKYMSEPFHLYIFSFDNRSYEILNKMNLSNVSVISLEELEQSFPNLLDVKPKRSKGEYCWTSTPFIIKYCLEKYNLDHCTYLDADIYFFNDPSILIEELGNKDVLITEHRYTPIYDQSKTSGIYCVQFMTFKNTENGKKVLNWWANACYDWCYARVENNKFGDQKYLDDWPQRFEGIHVLKHLGGGVAPWNVQQYTIFLKDNKLKAIQKNTGNEFEIIFYHFHGLKFYNNNTVDLCGWYRIDKEVVENIYRPYLKHIKVIKMELKKIDPFYDYNGKLESKLTVKGFLRQIKRKLRGVYNTYHLEYFWGD
ncbi:glycosyl transferase [Caldisericum exile]|uniref:glycosyl transferase n=1 Tax=Caldisericum exile TaxID=693075 RepID=UPI003C795174